MEIAHTFFITIHSNFALSLATVAMVAAVLMELVLDLGGSPALKVLFRRFYGIGH